MGLKGYRLWVMGQLDSNVQSPAARGGVCHVHAHCSVEEQLLLLGTRAVAVQVDPFESKGLKPGEPLKYSRVETRRFQAMLWVNWIQLVQPPPHTPSSFGSTRRCPSCSGSTPGGRRTPAGDHR
jgi:hypothetical protein